MLGKRRAFHITCPDLRPRQVAAASFAVDWAIKPIINLSILVGWMIIIIIIIIIIIQVIIIIN